MFDLLMLDGNDLRQLPLLKRKQRLARLLTGHPRLLEVEHIEHDGLSMFAGALALGLEGVVAKDTLGCRLGQTCSVEAVQRNLKGKKMGESGVGICVFMGFSLP